MYQPNARNIYKLAELKLEQRIDWKQKTNRIIFLANTFSIPYDPLDPIKDQKAIFKHIFGLGGITTNPDRYGENNWDDYIHHHHFFSDWLVENLTSYANIGSSFTCTGELSTVIGPSDSQHVFGRNNAGELIHYSWASQPGWQAENLTNNPNIGSALTFISNPVAINDPGNVTHHVFGRNAGGELIHYYWTALQGWHAENLTQYPNIGSHFIFQGDPVAIILPQLNSTHIFGLNSSGELIHYFWIALQGWQAENLTQYPSIGSNFIIQSEPLVINGPSPNTQHVFGRNNAGELIHYFWSSRLGWQAENLTQYPNIGNNFLLQGNLFVTNLLNPFVRVMGSQHVFGRNNVGQLIHYHWKPADGWLAENLTQYPNIGISYIFQGDPEVVCSPGGAAIQVFGKNNAGELIHYYWPSSAGWQAENLTKSLNSMFKFKGMPKSRYYFSCDAYSPTVLAASPRGEIMEFYWASAIGWGARWLLKPLPAPSFSIVSDINYVLGSNSSRGVFGLTATGELIHYWCDAYNPANFQDIDFNDVIQGAIGDCYFVAALAAVAQTKPQLLQSKVKGLPSNKFSVIFNKLVPRDITIDLTFAANERHHPILAESKDPNETWVQVYEKAYAVLHGGNDQNGNPNYCTIDGGWAYKALFEITGSIFVHRRISSSDKKKLWNRIQGLAKNEPMVANTYCDESSGNAPDYDNGLVGSHCYTVLDALESNGVKYLLLRNPWGTGELIGQNPTSITLPDGTIVNADINDGIFLITWRDFCKYFEHIDLPKK